MAAGTKGRQGGSGADRAGMRLPDAPADTAWPNGSGVFSMPGADQSRVELGRVVREGDAWRAWGRTPGGYVDMGACTSQVAGIAMLPEVPQAPPAPGIEVPAKSAAPGRAKPAKTAKPRGQASRAAGKTVPGGA